MHRRVEEELCNHKYVVTKNLNYDNDKENYLKENKAMIFTIYNKHKKIFRRRQNNRLGLM